MTKNRNKRQRSAHAHGAAPRAMLRVAERLMEDGDLDDARELLYSLARKYPSDVAVLELLSTVSGGLGDARIMWYSNTRLLELQPDDAASWHDAAAACMTINAPFSASYYVGQFLERWPDDEESPSFRELHVALTKLCDDIRKNYPMAADHSDADLVLFEKARLLTEIGDFEEGRRLARFAVERIPDSASPLNNLSLSYMIEGNLEEALKISQQVVERFPGNLHAYANIIQYLVRLGRPGEARQAAEKLKSLPLVESDDWVKRSEALSYLGDDEAVIETYRLVENDKSSEKSTWALGYHLAAVAFARQGDEKQARRLFRAALEFDPNMSLARDNLEDLDAPIDERTGPWSFAFGQWIPEQWVEDILNRATGRKVSEAAIARIMQRAMHDHPELASMIPILLERGDPVACNFALSFAITLKLPVLRDFVLGRHSMDEQRMRAGYAAVDLDLLPRGKPTRVMLHGEWTEMQFLSYDIYDRQQPGKLPRPAQKLMEQGYVAQGNGDFEEGLRLCEEALKIAPDDATLLNHKAAALASLGRIKETRATVQHMADLYPDYVFSRCGMAELCARDGKLDEAREWISPLLEKSSFHISEFTGMCKAYIEVLLADGQVDGARSWLQYLQQVVPDHAVVAYLEDRVRKARKPFWK